MTSEMAGPSSITSVQSAVLLAANVRPHSVEGTLGLVFEDGVWSWSAVAQECADRAKALARLVADPPDRQVRIGLLLDNRADFVLWTGAAAIAGAVVVGLGTGQTASGLVDQIRHADVDLVITEAQVGHLLAGHDHAVPPERIIYSDAWSAAAR